MKTAYISSPNGGKDEKEINRNLAYAITLTEFTIGSGEAAPIVPQLYLPQILDEDLKGDEEIAEKCAEQYLKGCDLMICGLRYGITNTMETEISIAEELKIPILWIDAEPKRLIGILDRFNPIRREDDPE